MQETMETKNLLAIALIKLTAHKSFDKITISDITEASGFNRQTFYYHFKDKFELLSWIYQQDAIRVCKHDISLENWCEYIKKLLEFIYEHKTFYVNTVRYDSSYFHEFIFKLTSSLFYRAIDSLDQRQQLDQTDKVFYSEFFSFGISGVMINWIKSDMKESPNRVASALKNLAKDSEKLAYQKYQITYTNRKGTDYETTN